MKCLSVCLYVCMCLIHGSVCLSVCSVTMSTYQPQYSRHWSTAVLVSLRSKRLLGMDRKTFKFTTATSFHWNGNYRIMMRTPAMPRSSVSSLSMYVCLSVCLSVCPSVCLSVRLSVSLSVCSSVCFSVCLFVCPSVCPSVCLSRSVIVYKGRLQCAVNIRHLACRHSTQR